METQEKVPAGIHHRDAQQAFRDAIGNSILSQYPSDENYAGNYMYMYSEGIQDAFKHRVSRQYLRTNYV